MAQLGRALRSGRKGRRFESCHPDQYQQKPIEISTFQWVFCFPGYPGNHEFPDHEKNGSVKNVGVEDTPRISEPLSFFEKTLFSSAPTGVSHR